VAGQGEGEAEEEGVQLGWGGCGLTMVDLASLSAEGGKRGACEVAKLTWLGCESPLVKRLGFRLQLWRWLVLRVHPLSERGELMLNSERRNVLSDVASIQFKGLGKWES
jgi:hypothetical protein